MNPQTGRRFGPYEIQSRLGGGGMGHVYRAWDARLHREVALKLLQSEFAMAGMRERFLREARAASALNHPNICTIFDIGEQDGDPYLVLELLEGETLRERIEHKALQTDEICCIGKEVAQALGAAHAKGIIHRDIKPANIFLVNRPNASVQAKVLDFGLAKIEGGVLGARTSRALDLTTEGSTVGTLAYMSPEQARGELLDSRSDLFSLGVMMYEMATRHVPFPGATSALIFVKLLNQSPEPIRDWNESVPRDLEKVILKLIAKERTARFQTAQEVIEALSHINEKPGGWLRKAVATVPLVRAPDPDVRGRRSSKRRAEERDYGDGGAAIARATPTPSSGEPQFLRPVVRMPREESTPRPVGAGPGPGSRAPDAAQTTPANLKAEAPVESTVPVAPVEAVLVRPVRRLSAAALTAPAAVKSGAVLATPKEALKKTSDAETNAAVSPVDVVLPLAVLPSLLAEQELSAPALDLPVIFPDAEILDEQIGEPATEPEQRSRRRLPLLGAAIGLLSLAIVGAVALLIANRGRFHSASLLPEETAVVTEIENRTGDRSLDETVAAGLEISLAQSPYLTLRSGAAYRLARRQLEGDLTGRMAAYETARRLGASAYFVGSIVNRSPPYMIHVELRRTASNDIMTSAEQQADSLQQVPDAIDRLSSELRAACGEDSDSIHKNSVALTHEATGNLAALRFYTQGNNALTENRNLEAIQFFQQAVALEPKFVLAQLRLASLYRKQRAEVSAAEAARLARAAADGTSLRTRTLAQFEYELNASGDSVRAAAILRRYLAAAPHDPIALESLARALRMQGHMAEALQLAQQAYTLDPYFIEAYAQAEGSLIGLDRFDAAFQLQEQMRRMGLARPGSTLNAAYLEGREDLVGAAASTYIGHREGYKPDWSYGIYLDNGGRLNDGADLWRVRAEQAAHIPGLESAAGTLLAQGAIDRALAGECVGGLLMARKSDDEEQGPTALFNSGMAHALCGDTARAQEIVKELRAGYPRSVAVQGFYLADIQAAVALQASQPEAALEYLKPARQYDLISLTPFLRGRAHVALHQTQIGIVDFQTVLAHRGVPFLVGSNVYPIAEIGVARAFADIGDMGNSANAYRRFLALWSNADKGQPLTAEAKAHLH